MRIIAKTFLRVYKNKITKGIQSKLEDWDLSGYSMVSNIIVKDKPNLYKYENTL